MPRAERNGKAMAAPVTVQQVVDIVGGVSAVFITTFAFQNTRDATDVL
jgi:hypothetical protein